MMRNMVCAYARTQAQADHHTHARALARTHSAVRLSERSAAERERGRRGGEQQPHWSSSERERQRLEQELGGEITAVLKKYFIAELQQFVGTATSCKAKCHRREKTTAPNMRITWDRIAWKRRLAKDRQVCPFVCLRSGMVTRYHRCSIIHLRDD